MHLLSRWAGGNVFLAIVFLINAPRQMKNLYDTLKELFEEIFDTLVKLQMNRRIDNFRRLEADLVENADRPLVTFIRIRKFSVRIL